MRTFQQIIEDAGFDPSPYSGRSMGGQECLSISTDSLSRFVADVVLAMLPEERLAVVASLRKMRTDTLGREQVVYFPGVPFAA